MNRTAAEYTDDLLAGISGRVGASAVPRRLGRARARRRMGAAPVARRLGARAERVEDSPEEPILYTSRRYNSGDVTYCGFGFINVPATPGLLTPVTTGIVSPDRPFTPQKLFIPSTQFGLFLLRVNIEGDNIFASSQGLACEIFSEGSFFPQMDWPDIDPSTGIEFVFANPGNVALIGSPGFYGTDLRR